MKEAIYACFDSLDGAQAAAGALIRAGVRADTLRIACKTTSQEESPALNPAQSDYPAPDALSSAPPSAQRDYNKGIDSDDYNRNYEGEVGKDMERDVRHQGMKGPAPNEAYETSHTINPAHVRGSEAEQLGEEQISYGAMPSSFPDMRAQGPGNSVGDSGSFTEGTRYAGIAAAASGTANRGGMTDFLWSSLPVDVAENLHEQYDDGKSILIVEEPTAQAESILTEHGGRNIQRQGYLA